MLQLILLFLNSFNFLPLNFFSAFLLFISKRGLFEQFGYNILVPKFFAFTTLSYHCVIFVFNHMLGSLVAHKSSNFRPFFAMISHKFK
jgi:hypothetical protein